MKNPYRTDKKKAWRNIMVSAVNAAIEQGHMDLSPDFKLPDKGVTFSFTTYAANGQSVDGLAFIRDAGFSEVKVHAALAPNELAASQISSSFEFSRNSIKKFCKAHAEGWLERLDGAWLQTGACKAYVAADYKEKVARIEVEPIGYKDHGQFKM